MAGIQIVLGNNIRRLRNQRGWSQVFLADKLSVSVSFISVIESGQRGVSLPLIESIAEAFDVPVPFLFTDHDAPAANAHESEFRAQLAELESDLSRGVSAYIADFFAQKRKERG